ncbi:MAG TPA: glycosyltransferase [Acidobacteriota bacterium]|nr:glycosyltransferase [Acidobacteriota bacterium]
MAKRVSILIPAYNAEKWIRETIGSALGQTWGDKEIIVMDDGSTDRTLEIARTLESESVRVLTQDNRGAAAARNRCLESASGDYIQWLDADDLLAPDKIAGQMKAAAEDRSDLILYSSPHGVFYHRLRKACFAPNDLWQDLAPSDWLVASMSKALWMNPAGWLVSRRLTEHAGPWDERLSMDDDGEYFARVVAACEKVKFVRESRCFYRQSSFRQLSRNMSERAGRSLVLSSESRIRTLLSLETSDRTRSAALSLLQARMPAFYPEKTALLEQLGSLASKLGGELSPPRLDRRARALQRVFGPEWGRGLRILGRRLRMARAAKWDELMDRFGL